jgi:hypothetical protein
MPGHDCWPILRKLARFRALLISAKHIPELDEVSAQRIGPQGVGDDPLRDLSPCLAPGGAALGETARARGTAVGSAAGAEASAAGKRSENTVAAASCARARRTATGGTVGLS